MRVLVVEDEEAQQRALARLIEGAGHDVTGAATASEAITRLSVERFDIVLLDIMLGAGLLNGFDVARYLQESKRRVPFIIISGLSADDIREGARSYSNVLSGAALIVGKPFDPSVLMSAIDRFNPDRRAP